MAESSFVTTRPVPEILRAISIIEPPVWTRLEPVSASGDPTPGLAAAIHDPLWILGRQWQFGEFDGEDAGMPLGVRIATEMQRVTAWQSGDPSANLPAHRLPPAEPLDPYVEREPPAASGVGLRQRVEAGAVLIQTLLDSGFDARAQLVTSFPLRLDVPAPPRVPPEYWKVPPRYPALARSVPDAEAVAASLEGGAPPWLAGASAEAQTAAKEWLRWYRSSVSPQAERANDSWVPERLEYRFSIRAGGAERQRVFGAPLHEGGHIDWYTFDQYPRRTLALEQEPEESAVSQREQVVLASPLRFGGMPSDRLWEFEDGNVNLGKLETQAHDLARLCFVEFAMIYSADWFVVPLDVDVGSFTRVTELTYTTTFGDTYKVPLADDRARGGRFRLFGITLAGTTEVSDGLLVAPSARGVIEGQPIEEVLLLRDEMANMVWAIERTVETITGETRSRNDEPRPVNRVENFVGGAELQYLLQTLVPAHWIPFVPVPTTGRGGFVLRKGTMSDRDASIGVLLHPTPFTLQEEEVPREGVRVRRVPSLARARDGQYVRWIARRVSVGRGEGASALAYDAAIR